MENLFMLLLLISIFALFIGLIKPNVVLKWLPEKKVNRKSVFLYFGIASIVFFVSFGITAPPSTENDKINEKTEGVREVVVKKEEKDNTVKDKERESSIEKKPVLKRDFTKIFEIDEAYDDGTFLMQDGTIEIADYYSTWGSVSISDMLVIFQNDELVAAKVFLNKGKKIEEGLIEIGWDIKDVEVKEHVNPVTGEVLAYDIVYNQLFKKQNIKNYPNELD